MAGLDLSGVTRALDEWIVDKVLIERTNGEVDDVLNPETGVLEGPPAAEVYHDRGMVQTLSGFTEIADPDVARIVESTGANYRALFPLHAQLDPIVGDLLRVTEQNGETDDPTLLRRRFQIVDLGGGTSFAVVRIVYMKQVAYVDPEVDPAP